MNTNHDAFQSETKALLEAVSLGQQISALEVELKNDQSLLNQLRLLKTNLESCREFLLSKDHLVAFVGSIGVGDDCNKFSSV